LPSPMLAPMPPWAAPPTPAVAWKTVLNMHHLLQVARAMTKRLT
jgi:hypothetical protein